MKWNMSLPAVSLYAGWTDKDSYVPTLGPDLVLLYAIVSAFG